MRAPSLRRSFLAIAACTALSGCGGSDAQGESTATSNAELSCFGAGVHPAICPVAPPYLPPAPTFPTPTGECTSGETCTFFGADDPAFALESCSSPYQFIESTALIASGSRVAYCATASLGLADVESWITQNPSSGGKLVTSVPGLPAAATGDAYLVFDADPSGPAFPLPTPFVCPSGLTCTVAPASPNWDITTAPCSQVWSIKEGDPKAFFAAYCAYTGEGATEVNTWVADHPNNDPTLLPSIPGFPAAAGYIYVEFYADTIKGGCTRSCD